MELEQMRQLDTFARTGTLKATAQELHLSASAISRSLHRLEIDLGTELFSRTNNTMSLNEAGELALEHARVLLAEERLMRQDFDALARRLRTIRVASVAPAPTWRISATTLESFPTTIVEPDIAGQSEVVSRMLERSCDLAVTATAIELPLAKSFPLMEEHLFVNVPLHHALAERDQVSFTELDGETFLLFGQIGFWAEVHARLMPHAHYVRQHDRTIFLQQVAASDILSFTTNASADAASSTGRVAVPISDSEAHVTYHLTTRTDAPELVREVFELLRSQAEATCA